MRAVHCAQAILQAQPKTAQTSGLTVRIGIGAGEAEVYYVGGIDGRWEALPMGDPFRQMGIAESQAKPGEVVVSPEAWQTLGGSAAPTRRSFRTRRSRPETAI